MLYITCTDTIGTSYTCMSKVMHNYYIMCILLNFEEAYFTLVLAIGGLTYVHVLDVHVGAYYMHTCTCTSFYMPSLHHKI